jgi:phosphomannomutase
MIKFGTSGSRGLIARDFTFHNVRLATDGFKYLFPSGERVAFRASGTEPLIRCYIEAKSQASLKKLRVAGQTLLTT